MPLVLTDARGTHHVHLLTRTISSSPAPSAFLGLIARADVVRCRLVHRLMMKSTHVYRASCACVVCCRGVGYVIPFVRLSVRLSSLFVIIIGFFS